MIPFEWPKPFMTFPPFAPFTPRVKRSGALSGDPLLDGLYAWYRNGPTDTSGSGRNLIAVGSPTTTTGVGGAANAAMATTDTDYFVATAPLYPGDTSTAFSLAAFCKGIEFNKACPFAWLYTGTGGTWDDFWSSGTGIYRGMIGAFFSGFGGFLTNIIDDNSNQYGGDSKPGSIGAFFHFGTTWEPTTDFGTTHKVKIYIDGVLQSTQYLVDVSWGVAFNSVTQTVGRARTTNAGAFQNLGAWYGRALSAAEMVTLAAGHDPTVLL